MSNSVSKHSVGQYQSCVHALPLSLFCSKPFVADFFSLLFQILSAVATDADIGYNAIIHYTITGETTSFYVGELSGDIATLQPLDYESHSQYMFILTAFNPGEPQLQDTTNITGSSTLPQKMNLH